MDQRSYIVTQQLLVNLGRAVQALPLDDFLEAIEKADAAGPALDPTLYRAGSGTMHDFRDLAEGAKLFKAAVDKVSARTAAKAAQAE